MYNVYIGFDPRQPVAYNVCQYSVITNASKPVSVTPLILQQLPIERRGLTEFTYSRFLVPYLSGFKGTSIFMDPDILVTGDIIELFEAADGTKGKMHVMKHQPKFEWPSVMVFNNGCCKKLTPDYVNDVQNVLYDHEWAGGEDKVATFPDEWNKAIGYADVADAKLHHYTMGIPCWPETCHLEAEQWLDYFAEATSTVPFNDLMGGSVHLPRLQETRNGA